MNDTTTAKPEPMHACDCGADKQEPPHTCPFAEEIFNDSESLCTCCKDCAYQCAMDI